MFECYITILCGKGQDISQYSTTRWPYNTGFPLYLENHENLEFFSFILPGLENAWNLLKKWEKPGILTWKNNLNFENWMFPDKLYKVSLQK